MAAMAPLTATRIDFNQTRLDEVYGNPNNYFAMIIENAFTPTECEELIALAESTGPWMPAAKNVQVRDAMRILRLDAETARVVFERVEPFLDEVRRPGKELESMIGKKGGGSGEKGRLNEMLRFLRYEEGQHFNLHCDATYNGEGWEKRQKSFLTLHLYLTVGESSSLKGGSTRFWSPDRAKFMDVEAKRGRVLVFQQRMLWHSGEPVTEGTKITMRGDIMFEWVLLKPPRPKGQKKKGGRVDERVETVKKTIV
ncbi:hypothetical protein HOY82DRAFT_673690 [Tuber indicum]|nr:hypothetical protein HOY82DRAFT_673690 [Tuber indicum]